IVTTSDRSIVQCVRGAPITAEDLVLTGQTLVVDQQWSSNIKVNDLDVKQVKPGFVDEQMGRMAYKFKVKRDTYIAGVMKAAVADDNILNSGSAYSVGTGASDADAYEILAYLAEVLDDNDTPVSGGSPTFDADGGPEWGMRFAVVPNFFATMLLLDPRRSSFGTTENLRAYGE